MSSRDTGDVHLAEHTMLHTCRILKRLNKQNPCYDQLKKEADILKRLNHPCIPALYDILEDQEHMILVEEYMEGESLKSFCARGEGLSEELFYDFAVQICDILHYLHSLEDELLYLDLKPENILISGRNLSLVDFGCAVPASRADQRRYGFGTPGFAAPELKQGGAVSVRTDIYSAGMVISYLYSHLNRGTDRRTVHSAGRIGGIIGRCRLEDPDKRYPNISELKKELTAAAPKCHIKEKDNRKKHILSQGAARDASRILRRRGKGEEKQRAQNGRIGVYGIHRAAGATCTAIQIALYLKRRRKKASVAILEMSGKEDFIQLESWYFGTEPLECTDESFLIRGVDFWKGVTEEKALRLYNSGYDYLVLDLGSGMRARKELLGCGRKIVIGSGAPWRTGSWRTYFDDMKELGRTDDWSYLFLPCVGKMPVMAGIPDVYEMPRSASVLESTREMEELFERLL